MICFYCFARDADKNNNKQIDREKIVWFVSNCATGPCEWWYLSYCAQKKKHRKRLI